MILDVYPHRAFYRPGEVVQLDVSLTGQVLPDVQIVISIVHLSDEMARLSEPIHRVSGQAATSEMTWTPPPVAPRGYGVDAWAVDGAGRVIAATSSAFDVLERWTQAPRYGFLTDFCPERANLDSAMRWLAAYHVNGLQFYDWMYRHDQLLPPTDVFRDPLGRRLSLTTVHQLIDAAHARGIAAMPYTAIYAASTRFFRQHPGWALRDAEGDPILFGDDFLAIMNPAPGSPWTGHLQAQFAQVLAKTEFDGVHLDQYGDPKLAYDSAGNQVDLGRIVPRFIDRTKRTATRIRADATVAFNCVGNWPIERAVESQQDFVYIEVWPPDTQYEDLNRLIIEAQTLSDGKPVVLAAYVDPEQTVNARLTDAVIFASGGYHIELGEPGGMLSDPYFPKYGRMSNDLASALRRYYDFLVRYENVLSLDTLDTTARRSGQVTIEGIDTDASHLSHKVWVITREGPSCEAINLINLLDVSDPAWNGSHDQHVTPVTNVRVRCYSHQPVQRIRWASPDDKNPQMYALDFRVGTDEKGTYVTFAVPVLMYWDLIIVEHAAHCQRASETPV
jgi:dextranase